MKKLSIFITCLVCAIGSAQNINDVLRFSQENLQGTARYQAMGGAFGALGGDLSALNNNPAGSAVFNHGLFTMTGSNYNRDNTSNYFGTSRNLDFNTSELNQIGGVLVFNNSDDEADWNHFSIAFNYDLVENFDDRTQVEGRSNQGIDSYFLAFANGLPLEEIVLDDGELIERVYEDIGANPNNPFAFDDQQTFLGFQGGIIDPVTNENTNTTYIRNASYSEVAQRFTQITSGYNAKYTINVATQYQKKLHLGASINIHDVFYEQIDLFTESGYDDDSAISSTTFDNLLRINGGGFSLGLGSILKINETVRLGASYQSPTWYRLTADTSQELNSDFAQRNPDIIFINFNNAVNLFETYTLKTPGKLTASMALIFGKRGLLSVDYDYQDFSSSKFSRRDNPEFINTANSEITEALTGVSTVRVGGEYRIQRFSLRGGYRYEQSPYVNGTTVGDLTGFSGGLGYDFGGSRLDLAFSRAERTTNLQLFDVGVTTPAIVDRVNTNISLGYTLNF